MSTEKGFGDEHGGLPLDEAIYPQMSDVISTGSGYFGDHWMPKLNTPTNPYGLLPQAYPSSPGQMVAPKPAMPKLAAVPRAPPQSMFAPTTPSTYAGVNSSPLQCYNFNYNNPKAWDGTFLDNAEAFTYYTGMNSQFATNQW